MARFQTMEFANIQLGKADEKQFSDWVAEENVKPLEAVQRLLGDGFKVSCSWVFSQSAFCFTIVGTDETPKHKGICMTTWSDDLEEVMALAVYKHYVICDGQDWPTQSSGSRWG